MIFRVKFDRTKNLKFRSRSNVNKGNFYYFSFPPAIYGLKKKNLQRGNETIPKSGKNGHSTFCRVVNKCNCFIAGVFPTTCLLYTSPSPRDA